MPSCAWRLPFAIMSGKVGVPAVLEQKTTILWKCLYLLASLKDSPGLGEVYRQAAEVGKKTLFMGEIPRETWTKSGVFVHHTCGRRPSFSSPRLPMDARIVVFCTPTPGTPR